MQPSRALIAAACCLLFGGTAFAQGGGANAVPHNAGRMGGHASRINGNFNAARSGPRNFNTAGNWRGARGWPGRWAGRPARGTGWGGTGWGSNYAWGYPDEYGWAYGYPDYAYGYGYPYAAGGYCETPENSCPLDQPAAVGDSCMCENGIDQVPGAVEP